MSKFLLCATFGLYLLQLCLAETQFNISCRYAGVFHVEKNRRYSLTRNESIELCRALNSTLPTMEQMTKAHKLGFETCRYGFIEDKIVIPRIKPYFLCAANYTGIYILNSNTSDRYDTYCYNASETRDQACEPIIRFDASWADNHTKIVIDNADGSRYMDGVRHTEPTPVTEDDRVGSGSIHDSDTTNPTIIRTRISGSPYYEVPSTDYSSGSGRKEYHPTRTNHIAPLDEDSTQISLMTERDNDHPNKRPHPTSTTVDHDHYTYPETTTPWWQSLNSKEQHPITDSNADLSSQDGGADDDSTQDPLVAVISLGGDHSGDKKLHPPSTTVNPHHGAHEETSTQRVGNPSPDSWWWSTTGLKEHLTTMPFDDEDSQENESADEDSLQDPLHSGWGKNDDKEDHIPVTNVDSLRDSKRTESTADPLLHNVYLGRDKDEDKYSKNTTGDSVKPAHFPGKERDHSSSVTVNKELGHKTHSPTAVVGPNEGAKNEVPTKDPGWFNEVKYSTKATRNDVLPGVIPSRGSEHSTTAEVPNDYAKHEGPVHSAPSPADPRWSKEDKYPTNITRDEVLHGLIPLSESEHKDGSSPTAVVSMNGAKHGGSTQDPPSYVDLLGWGSEDKYPTNTTKTDVQHGLVPSSESEQKNRSTPIETAVTSSDGTIHEDSTHGSLPPDNQPGWGSEGKYPTKTSRKNVMHELIPQNENEYKDESYTAVVSNAGATHEDSTHDPLLHGVHPEWGNEDRYSTNTSRDDLLRGIIPPSETEHEKESPYTVVISSDGVKHEDSTTDALAPGIQPGRDNEDKYPTNNTRDNLIPGVFSDFESGHGRETASTITSFTSNKHDSRIRGQDGQTTTTNIFSQPRSAQIPEWLIIVASLVALTLVLAVCIAVNSRRRCGQKKKLVINNGKGSVSDKKMSGLNGEASKSQEMVHLVHKEQPDNRKGTCDEILTTDETQNQQEAGMKTGL
nr:CD44 antigen isoform X4 [Pelodiscus sinensis]|eukprot:XP_025041108.1 CD44 antigen isoform X4 [Pelodiscus sinensis]